MTVLCLIARRVEHDRNENNSYQSSRATLRSNKSFIMNKMKLGIFLGLEIENHKITFSLNCPLFIKYTYIAKT